VMRGNQAYAGTIALATSVASKSFEECPPGIPMQTSVTIQVSILDRVSKMRFATRHHRFFIPSHGSETSL
jgi:hypothetical protein